MADKRRRFGAIRKLPSGRWQARYQARDGLARPAPRTFEGTQDSAALAGARRAKNARLLGRTADVVPRSIVRVRNVRQHYSG